MTSPPPPPETPGLPQLETLFRAARGILGAADPLAICQQLTQYFTTLVGADRVLIFLVDHDQRQITLAVHNGHIVDDLDTTYDELSQGLSGVVLRSGQAVLSTGPDDGLEPAATLERRRKAGTGAVLVVPLTVQNAGETPRVIGTVTALNRLGQRVFTHHDVDLLLSLATQAAAAIAGARLQHAERERRRLAEALLLAGRKLSGSANLHEVPGRVLEQLAIVVPFERGSLMLRDGEALKIVAQRGFPDEDRARELRVPIRAGDVFTQIAEAGRPLVIADVTRVAGWLQVEWLPVNRSWMGVPLFSRDEVIGMISLTRPGTAAFDHDDTVLASTFALQVVSALENAELYDEITRFNEQLEQMVRQRTDELHRALQELERLDRNKSDFIGVAAHELRTPLTVIKGYLLMMQNDPQVQNSDFLPQAVNGVLNGVERLYEIISSMLDVARIDSQILELHPERTSLTPVIKRVQADLRESLAERNLSLILEDLSILPQIQADGTLLLKVFQNLIWNAVKYTPDGGCIRVGGRGVDDAPLGACVEIWVQDNGIGIDPEHHELIFEKFYQTGKVDLHSSGKTKFKGGGPGLGLAIARGIVQAHFGRIWVESECHDEVRCPGSCFHVLLPVDFPKKENRE